MKLTRIDPQKNMHRFYEVHIQSSLLDSHVVVCIWGSIKNQYHRVRMIKTATKEEAQKVAERIIEQKTKNGYK